MCADEPESRARVAYLLTYCSHLLPRDLVPLLPVAGEHEQHVKVESANGRCSDAADEAEGAVVAVGDGGQESVQEGAIDGREEEAEGGGYALADEPELRLEAEHEGGQ